MTTEVPTPRQPADAKVGKDGKDVENEFIGHLDYLSKLANHLGIADPVEEYFAPTVGRWSDLHAEAERWRVVGEGAGEVTEALGKPLGKLDAAWDGAAADSFIAYMQQVGLAGNDLSDAMIAMADVLDKTADGIREIVVQLATVLAETAETASEAMTLPVQGDDRTREYLDLMRRPSKELFEAVRQILEAFVQLCEGVDGEQAFEQVKMAHTFPGDNWSYTAADAGPRPACPWTTRPTWPARRVAAVAGLGGGGGGGAGGGGGGVGAAAGGPARRRQHGGRRAGAPRPRGARGTGAAAAAASGGGRRQGRHGHADDADDAAMGQGRAATRTTSPAAAWSATPRTSSASRRRPARPSSATMTTSGTATAPRTPEGGTR